MSTILTMVWDFQYSYGGPIIAVQVENEYGSYNKDPNYLPWLKNILIENGIIELLYTSDGGSNLVNPKTHLLEDVLYTVNFQTVGNNLKDLAEIQPNRFGHTIFWQLSLIISDPSLV